MASLGAHARGYAFEKFLRDLFDADGLAPQEPFRFKGEQIEAAFSSAMRPILSRPNGTGQPIGVAELHTFHGKIEQKAA